MVWAAAWLFHATNDQTYLNYIQKGNNGGVRSYFSWDDKFVGAQTLVSKVYIYHIIYVLDTDLSKISYKFDIDV